MKIKRFNRLWLAVFFVGLAIGILFYNLEFGGVYKTERVKVVRVVDGDTLETADERIRLIGVDAPELGECFAEESRNKLTVLVEKSEVRLEKDVSERDKYDRLLRYAYVGEINVSDVLVREGFAKLATYPPDTKYYGVLKEAEKVARERKLGLWGKCSI